jgi:hypothetical protein
VSDPVNPADTMVRVKCLEQTEQGPCRRTATHEVLSPIDDTWGALCHRHASAWANDRTRELTDERYRGHLLAQARENQGGYELALLRLENDIRDADGLCRRVFLDKFVAPSVVLDVVRMLHRERERKL